MVGRGGVDAELESEISAECQSKYGQVVKCVAREIPSDRALLLGVGEDEAVRIFVQFADLNAAKKGTQKSCADFC